MRPQRCPMTVTRKAHGTMSVTAYQGSRATVSNEKQLEGDQVCALGARWHRCWAGTTARRSIQRRHRRQVVSHTRSFMGTFALSADEFLVTWAGLAVTPSHDPTYIQAITQTSQSIRQSVAGNTIAGQ